MLLVLATKIFFNDFWIVSSVALSKANIASFKSIIGGFFK